MSEVSTLRLYLLRAMYLLITVGLGITIWPGIISPPENLSHMASVVRSVLGAVALLALLGIRYPLKMLPLLLFELLWKSIWVIAFGLPLWLDQKLDANTSETLCLPHGRRWFRSYYPGATSSDTTWQRPATNGQIESANPDRVEADVLRTLIAI
jgi:hypothetical protein